MANATIMDSARMRAGYDGLGWFYNKYWSSVCEKMMPALDRLVLRDLPRGARVLDLCCGTGHLAAALSRRRFRVTGLDSSPDMVRFARRSAPRAEFVVADARRFAFAEPFDAIISTGDSMNHMLTPEDLASVFTNVRNALKPGGVFVFDLNMAEAFQTEWRKSSTVVEPDHLMYVRGRYDKPERLGSTQVTLFSNASGWQRVDLTIFQRCYQRREVRRALLDAGFAAAVAHPAKSLGMRGRLAVGRNFFVSRAPARADAMLPCEECPSRGTEPSPSSQP